MGGKEYGDNGERRGEEKRGEDEDAEEEDVGRRRR